LLIGFNREKRVLPIQKQSALARINKEYLLQQLRNTAYASLAKSRAYDEIPGMTAFLQQPHRTNNQHENKMA